LTSLLLISDGGLLHVNYATSLLSMMATSSIARAKPAALLRLI
jgi:hypothetical protein